MGSYARTIFEAEISQWLRSGGEVESLCGNCRKLAGVIAPRGVNDVQRIVCAASKARGAVKLQPLSCGKNWGFGSGLPTGNETYILDLSGLRRIRSLSVSGHCAELEAGVTQGSLDEALRAEGQSHYFNVTGAGLEASVIGNALERGIGYSGHRHLDLLDLEVVLPTGDVTQTSRFAFSSISPYHGGLGPDPTGLFCQSNFGIVTAATVPLHRRPEVMGGVLCHLADHRFLSDFISVLSDVIAEGACHGVPHLFNRERVVTTLSAHLEPARAAELKAGAASWTALIPIKGCRAVFEASANYLKTVLGPFGRIEILGEKADAALSGLVQGHPSDVALASVAFSVFGRSAQINAPMEASGAGLIHVTPVVPLCGKEICNIEHQTHQTLRHHGYEGVPLSLNALSARTAVLVVSLGFDRRCPEKTQSARKAAADLLKTYLRSGLVPYRLGLEQGNLIPPMERPWMRIISEIQRIFDPSGCMAPSRYEPLWRGMLPPQETNETKGAELCTTQ